MISVMARIDRPAIQMQLRYSVSFTLRKSDFIGITKAAGRRAPHCRGRLGRGWYYWTASIRFIRSAYGAPYFSRTEAVAS
ncbi:hypothetical protein PPUJ20188_52280 [Pseudomonas putida]|nr:hypothetical protein PPUJ20188_52280 [Pseudomonas putida]